MIYEVLLTKTGCKIVIQGVSLSSLRGGFRQDGRSSSGYEQPPLFLQDPVKTIPIPAEILRTNHQIHNEATPILYGLNMFRFVATNTSCSFLCTIGNSISWLQHVELWGRRNVYARSRGSVMAEYLVHARNLKCLNLRIFEDVDCSTWVDGSDLANDLEPLLKALYDREKDVEQAIEIVSFGTHFQIRQHCNNDHSTLEDSCPEPKCREDRAKYKRIVTEFKARARVYLGVRPARRDTGRPKRTTARDIDYSSLGDSL